MIKHVQRYLVEHGRQIGWLEDGWAIFVTLQSCTIRTVRSDPIVKSRFARLHRLLPIRTKWNRPLCSFGKCVIKFSSNLYNLSGQQNKLASSVSNLLCLH